MPCIVTGRTHRFRGRLTRDGENWDLTGATVKAVLRDPTGNVTESAATIESATTGVVYYTTTTAQVVTLGDWSFCWGVTQGPDIDVRSYPPIDFVVDRSP